MKIEKESKKITNSKNQLHLYGYENYFNYFVKLFMNKNVPNTILFSGPKGSGKSTFAYHLINYFLSKNENNAYSIKNFSIDRNNSSFKHLINNTHPNFFLIENNFLENDIKIEQIKKLLKFLNKSTYSKDLKIVLIDNAEDLNLNSSNALLKSVEEPTSNTFFILIHDSYSSILDTIKSRCTEFKFFFTETEKKNIFSKIIKDYNVNYNINEIPDFYYLDTPGNLIKYFLSLSEANININENTLKCIFYLIAKFKIDKSPETLSFISFFIEKFYNELCIKNSKNFNSYFLNKSKILNQINQIKKFNLDEKNIFIYITDILHNEER